MSRKLKIVLIGVLLGITVIGGGVWYFMEKVEQEKQELIQKSAQEIEDFYQWNYIGVEKTTTGKLWKNPASGELELDYSVYVGNLKKHEFSASWNKDGDIELGFFGNKSENKPTIKVAESGMRKKGIDPYNYLLQPKDIKKLRKKGYTKKISGEEIKNYLRKTYPENIDN